MNIVIAAGGTGGHINPGILIAKRILKENSKAKITFIGTQNGLEKTLIPKEGFDIRFINISGFKRKLTLKNLLVLKNLVFSLYETKIILKELKPDLVIGTGGYVCGPVLYIAKSFKIPTVIHESNALPGITTKFLTTRVDKVLVGFNDAIKRLDNRENVICTGNPVKETLNSFDKNNVRQSLGIQNDRPILLVFGGSQGAKKINDAIVDLIIRNRGDLGYNLIFCPGPKNYDNVTNQVSKIENIKNVKIFPYIYNMDEVMAASDLVISRSGALTISELCASGTPSILIPLASAAENHQEYNARALEKSSAAKVVLEKELSARYIEKQINSIINDQKVLETMSTNAKSMVKENAIEKIYNEIKEYLFK